MQPNLPAKPNRLESLLQTESIKARFEAMLGKKAAGFISSIISATKANKLLQDAEPMSIISSAAIAASLDLPINPSLGFAYIVPYRDKTGASIAQFQIGWRGFVQLAMRSGQFKTLSSTPVLDGQLVKNNRFTGEMEFQEAHKSDAVIGYLFYFRLLNGFEKYVYWTKEKCEAHGKRYSKSYAKGFGPWKDDFDSMALKTVVKDGLSKYAPLSVEMQTAIVVDQGVVPSFDSDPVYIDNQADSPSTPEGLQPMASETAPAAKKTSRLAKALAVGAAKSAEPVTEEERIAAMVDQTTNGDSSGFYPSESPPPQPSSV